MRANLRRSGCVMLAGLVSSCAGTGRRPVVLSGSEAVPELSVVHVSGKLTRVPKDSLWPASIKVGAPFDYWAVIDNRVKDTVADPHRGAYTSREWPARYDLTVGGIRFSSDRLSPRQVSVTVQDDNGPNDDGYNISSGYHTTLPEAPQLHAVSFHVGLKTSRRDLVTSDTLPIRPMKLRDLDGGRWGRSQFMAIALSQADGADQSLLGKADVFEVFQATRDTPLERPGGL